MATTIAGSTPTTLEAAVPVVQTSPDTLQSLRTNGTTKDDISAVSPSEASISENCYLFVKTKIPNLPQEKYILNNSKPKVGAVAIFYYKNNLEHLAYVTALGEKTFTVIESNYIHGVIASREVSYQDYALVGFWSP